MQARCLAKGRDYIFNIRGKENPVIKKAAILLMSVLVLLYCGCGNAEKKSSMGTILISGELTRIIENSGDSLVAFDLYADWCAPCRVLGPTLEEVAKENKRKVTFYRVNVDQVQDASQIFPVSSIPYVVFVKNKKTVATLTGVQPKESYEKVIKDNSKK
jgi:thioredoxin 1